MSIFNYSACSTQQCAKLLIQVALLVSLNCAAHAGDKSATHVLFNGRDLNGWRRPTGEWMVAGKAAIDRHNPKTFSIRSGRGVLVNGAQGRTVNLISEFEHGDVEAHIEFCVPKDSNSGVYFQGRYEVQILDSWGVEHSKYSDCGGIYERWKDDRGFEGHAPRVNASKKPGAWQTFDVIFRAPRFDAAGKKIQNARFVKVVHNGKLIHENVEVTGPTRAAIYESNENAHGRLMLQGDHGPVAFRKLRLKSIQLP